MKKTLFLAIIAGVALAGCVKNEEVAKGSDGSPERIAFEAPVVGVPVRATEIYGSYPTGNDFAVYALYHENRFTSYSASTLYMKDVQCTHQGTGAGDDPNSYWTPTGTYYWPKNGYLTFAAYAPAKTAENSGTGKVWNGATIVWDNNGFKFNNFKVKDTPADQIDLLYSDRAFDKQKTDEANNTPAPYDGIQLTFNHALSSIVFTARALTANAVKLTGIKVYNIYSKASFAQNLAFTASVNDDTPGHDNTDNKAKWSGHSDLITSTSPYVVYENKNNPVVLTTDANTEEAEAQPVYIYENTIANSLSTATNGTRKSSLIVLPQILRAEDRTADAGYIFGEGETAQNATVLITYKINHGGAWLDQQSIFKLAVADTAADTDSDPTYVWEMGKRYIYNITIGLDEIHFSPKVTDWVDQNGALIK